MSAIKTKLKEKQEQINRKHLKKIKAFLVAEMANNLPSMWETWFQSLGWEDPLEKGMETHSKYSCLENSMDRGARWATAHGVSALDMTEHLTLSLKKNRKIKR